MSLGQISLAAVLMATAGCGASADTPSDTEATAYSEVAPEVGDSVEFYLYTHCGVESLRLGGRWWHAVEPLYGNNGPGDSPEGWGDPYEKGRLVLESEERVTFEAEGTKVAFVPAADDRQVSMCR